MDSGYQGVGGENMWVGLASGDSASGREDEARMPSAHTHTRSGGTSLVVSIQPEPPREMTEEDTLSYASLPKSCR